MVIHRSRATKGYYKDGRVVVQERRGEVQLPSSEAAKRRRQAVMSAAARCSCQAAKRSAKV
jgi:hypothetical protein